MVVVVGGAEGFRVWRSQVLGPGAWAQGLGFRV